MNHLPFKEWLLSEEPLTGDQALAFRDHLRDCAECQQAQASWDEVQGLFQRSPQVEPRVGFTARYQERVAARRARRQRIHLGLTLLAGGLLLLVIVLLLGTQLAVLFQSPTRFLTICLAQLASLFVLFSSLQDYLVVLLKSFPVLPLLGLTLAVGFISFLGVLWVTTYQQVVIARRFTK